MTPSSVAQPFLAEAGAGRILNGFGEKLIFHLGTNETGGKLALWTELTPPGGGPPPHYHDNEDEMFIVQEGRFAFQVNGEWSEVGPGAVAFMPRKVVHAFKNVGTETGRLLVSTQPAGFEIFFSRCAEEFQQSGGPNMGRIFTISAEHGIHFV